ncbi:MAG: PRC-barrel domain-containing protein [Verrucomicrobiota bacterium]
MSNRHTLLPITFAALALALTLPAHLFASANENEGSSQNNSGEAKAAGQDSGAYALMRVSDLIGRDVKDADGRKLGDIVNLVIDLESHRVTHALVMTGGILDLGGDVRAIPAAALSPQENGFSAAIMKEAFTSQEIMPEDRVEALRSDYGRALETYYGDAHHKAAKAAREHDHVLLYSDLMSYKVRFRDDQSDANRLDAVLVDLARNSLAYLELSGLGSGPFGSSDSNQRTMIPATLIQEVRQDSSTLQLDLSIAEAQDADALRSLKEIEEQRTARGVVYNLSAK